METNACVTTLVRTVPALEHCFGESTFAVRCEDGEYSLLSSFAPTYPSKTREFFEYGRKGEIKQRFRLQREYLSAVGDVLEPMLWHSRTDREYDEAIVHLGGPDMPMRLLCPYEGFPRRCTRGCRRMIHEEYADWLC